MSKLLITGSKGKIGTVLSAGLTHDIAQFDAPEHDVRDYQSLVEAARGCDAIIHLAWDTVMDNCRTETVNVENYAMAQNVFRAAAEVGMRRVIIASSVNTDRFTNRTLNGLLRPTDPPIPNSPYGAEKVAIEAMGRYYADAKQLDVVCIRFGNVNPEDAPAPPDPGMKRVVWLSHRDCISLVEAALSASLPDHYEIVYGVSDNKGRLHDVTNRLGWKPVDSAE